MLGSIRQPEEDRTASSRPGLTFRRSLITARSVSEMYSHSPRWRLVAGSKVEPNTIVGDGGAVVLDPALTQRLPVPALDLVPFDRNGGIGRRPRSCQPSA
jgi:hypothetical protein